jgi:hypothetical protein
MIAGGRGCQHRSFTGGPALVGQALGLLGALL